MSNHKSETNRAIEYLDGLLREAVEAGADTIELERVPEGLEICFLTRGAGGGTVLEDRELEAELFALIVHRAGLEDRARGKMAWSMPGGSLTIAVEEYDSFGEYCLRLRLAKLRPPGHSRGPSPNRR